MPTPKRFSKLSGTLHVSDAHTYDQIAKAYGFRVGRAGVTAHLEGSFQRAVDAHTQHVGGAGLRCKQVRLTSTSIHFLVLLPVIEETWMWMQPDPTVPWTLTIEKGT